MKSLLINCPVTGKPVATGIVMTEGGFANSKFSNNSVGCPHCGQMHVWNKENAYLEGTGDLGYRAGFEKNN